MKKYNFKKGSFKGRIALLAVMYMILINSVFGKLRKKYEKQINDGGDIVFESLFETIFPLFVLMFSVFCIVFICIKLI